MNKTFCTIDLEDFSKTLKKIKILNFFFIISELLIPIIEALSQKKYIDRKRFKKAITNFLNAKNYFFMIFQKE